MGLALRPQVGHQGHFGAAQGSWNLVEGWCQANVVSECYFCVVLAHWATVWKSLVSFN